MEPTSRKLRRGVTLIDTLIGTLIIVVTVIGVMNLMGFLMRLTTKNQQLSVAYSVARSSVESVRNQGFPRYPDGTSTLYYDAYGTLVGALPGSSSSYRAVTTVGSSAYAVGTTTKPAATSIRTVNIQVFTYPRNERLINWGTSMVRGGI